MPKLKRENNHDIVPKANIYDLFILMATPNPTTFFYDIVPKANICDLFIFMVTPNPTTFTKKHLLFRTKGVTT